MAKICSGITVGYVAQESKTIKLIEFPFFQGSFGRWSQSPHFDRPRGKTDRSCRSRGCSDDPSHVKSFREETLKKIFREAKD